MNTIAITIPLGFGILNVPWELVNSATILKLYNQHPKTDHLVK